MAEERDVGEERALVLDRLLQRDARASEGMAATRLREAPQQRCGGRLEVEHAAIDAAATQAADVLGQRAERGAARIDADGDALVPRFGQVAQDLVERAGGQVIDAVEAAVLQHVQRDALARARQAADQDELHAYSSCWRICCCWRPRNSCVESMPRSLRISFLTAASTSTARLRPAATGIVTLRMVTPRMSSVPSPSGSRSAASRLPGCGRSRWVIRRSFIFRRTAVSPKMVRMLSR